MMIEKKWDAVIIGGGFYGCAIAIYLAKERGLKKILILEKESQLLHRASYHNQARVHNGYHYPRSFTTAFRSRVNLPKFLRDWPKAIYRDYTKLYAIARRNSKVTAKQFERFCHEIGAKMESAPITLRTLFEPRLIEDVFVVEEYAFNATQLAQWAKSTLQEYKIHVAYETQATAIHQKKHSELSVRFQQQNSEENIHTRYVFNCAYSGLNQLHGDFLGTQTSLKQELTEMALIQAPPQLQGLGITVMDGPFFSMMPFPARNLHTLSHVRYTPHLHWKDEKHVDPYHHLKHYHRETRFDRMQRDTQRYLPAIAQAKYIDSLFEIKTVLVKNESDDGRPILFEKQADLPGCYSVLGGKIDNIYDIFEKLDNEIFSNRQEKS